MKNPISQKITANPTAWLKLLVLTTGMLFSTLAFAVDLDSAKSQGLIGERLDGYLGVVVENPSDEVKSLVEDVNTKRRARYQQIAKKNNIDLADVEARAGQKAIERTAPGGWVFQARWEKKP
jgi:uncharacterized protein YdbL (DUF1318 family)